MTRKRFLDRFQAFVGEPQQIRGAELLHEAISKLPGGNEILREDAPWAVEFSRTPRKPAGAGAKLFDPRGSEEEGLIGPKAGAPMKAGDSYLLVNDRDQDMEAYDHNGRLLWKVPCLARGQGGDREWRHTGADTPPGLYRLGAVYRDYEDNPKGSCNATSMSYGWYSFDMVELEGQEMSIGRAGIMLHGGGTGCGWPGAWAPEQTLLPTLGCVRVHNRVLRDRILPLYEKGTVFVGVFQEP